MCETLCNELENGWHKIYNTYKNILYSIIQYILLYIFKNSVRIGYFK